MKNKNKIILDLCGGTGAWSKPYKDAGYTVYNITVPHYDVENIILGTAWIKFLHTTDFTADIEIKFKKIYGILAAPPCTMFSLARQNAKIPRNFKKGMEIVKACLHIIWICRYDYKIKFWALENPTGYLRQFLGRPAFKFQPYEFGDNSKKRTDLWGYFKEPKKNSIPKPGYLRKGNTAWATQHLKGQKGRSITPEGFAKAFYEANK